jgi:hypothetical protein
MTGCQAARELALDEPDDCLDTACQLLLTRDAPVSIGQLADELGAGQASVAQVVADHERRGRIGRDTAGMIVASAGVSVVPSAYELHVAARVLWAWCAKTALGVTSALGLGGVILSRSPYSGARLRTCFTGIRPVAGTSGAVLWPSDTFRDSCGSAAANYCPAFSLFESAEAARAWAAENQVPGEILTVEEATGKAAQRWLRSLDIAVKGPRLAAALGQPSAAQVKRGAGGARQLAGDAGTA